MAHHKMRVYPASPALSHVNLGNVEIRIRSAVAKDIGVTNSFWPAKEILPLSVNRSAFLHGAANIRAISWTVMPKDDSYRTPAEIAYILASLSEWKSLQYKMETRLPISTVIPYLSQLKDIVKTELHNGCRGALVENVLEYSLKMIDHKKASKYDQWAGIMALSVLVSLDYGCGQSWANENFSGVNDACKALHKRFIDGQKRPDPVLKEAYEFMADKYDAYFYEKGGWSHRANAVNGKGDEISDEQNKTIKFMLAEAINALKMSSLYLDTEYGHNESFSLRIKEFQINIQPKTEDVLIGIQYASDHDEGHVPTPYLEKAKREATQRLQKALSDKFEMEFYADSHYPAHFSKELYVIPDVILNADARTVLAGHYAWVNAQ
jgi:hypothetical protein